MSFFKADQGRGWEGGAEGKEGNGNWNGMLTVFSIREFCELRTPIFMFDKDGSFVVMRLEQVSKVPNSMFLVGFTDVRYL